jgi:hypothetical protein
MKTPWIGFLMFVCCEKWRDFYVETVSKNATISALFCCLKWRNFYVEMVSIDATMAQSKCCIKCAIFVFK